MKIIIRNPSSALFLNKIKINTYIDLKKCFICQEIKDESLECPAEAKHKYISPRGYKTLAEQLVQFSEIVKLQILRIENIDEGQEFE